MHILFFGVNEYNMLMNILIVWPYQDIFGWTHRESYTLKRYAPNKMYAYVLTATETTDGSRWWWIAFILIKRIDTNIVLPHIYQSTVPNGSSILSKITCLMKKASFAYIVLFVFSLISFFSLRGKSLIRQKEFSSIVLITPLN